MKNFTKFLGRNRGGLMKVLLVVVGMLFSFDNYAQTTLTYSTAGTYTWICPQGVTSIQIECWGAGGGGGGKGGSVGGGGGGGGGAYTKKNNFIVNPGQIYTFYVGAGGTAGDRYGADINACKGGNGEDSWFYSSTTIKAIGGTGGGGWYGSGGVGAAAVSSGNIGGDVNYYGGAGGNGATTPSGGGGGASAGTSSNGSNANGTTAGTAVTGGVAGATGVTGSTAGAAGNSGGGGGSGASATSTNTRAGGVGGDGKITISFYETSCSTLFEQDFSSSNTISDYTSSSPSSNQFTKIYNASISNGRLYMSASSPIISRTFDFNTIPTALQFQFDVEVSGSITSAGSPSITLYIGQDFTDGVTSSDGIPISASSTKSHSDISISTQLSSANSFAIRHSQGGIDVTSSYYSGNKTVTWIVNNSGNTLTYFAPDGSAENIANDKMDVWIGNIKVHDDKSSQNTSNSLKNFYIKYLNGTFNIYLDNFKITNLVNTNVPVATAATTKTSTGFTANWNSVSGATKYYLDISTNSNFTSFVSGYNNKDVGNVLSYSTSNLANLSQGYYYYRVRAYDGSACTGNSNTISVETTCNSALTGTLKIGPGNGYTTNFISLTEALNFLKNSSCGYGNVILELQSDYEYNRENLPLDFTGLGSSSKTITIRPAIGVTSINISGSNSTAIFDLLGADYITVDGRAGGTGSTSVLTISNTNTAGNVFRFTNGSTYNTIQYCTINSAASSTVATVLFGTSSTDGNSNNRIDNCIIAPASGTQKYGIESTGSASYVNTSNTISNCQIKDFSDDGIFINSNSDAWSISANHIYVTSGSIGSTTASTVNIYSMVYINSGTGYTISANYLGGKATYCNGGYLNCVNNATASGDNLLYGIYLGTGLTGATSSNINNNFIKYLSSLETQTAKTATVAGISLNTSSTTLNLYQNEVSYIYCDQAKGPSYITTSGASNTSLNLNMYKNKFDNISTGGANGNGQTTTAFDLSGISTSSITKMYNNIIKVNIATYTGNSTNFGIGTWYIYNNNFYYTGSAGSNGVQSNLKLSTGNYTIYNNILIMNVSSSSKNANIHFQTGATITHNNNYYDLSNAASGATGTTMMQNGTNFTYTTFANWEGSTATNSISGCTCSTTTGTGTGKNATGLTLNTEGNATSTTNIDNFGKDLDNDANIAITDDYYGITRNATTPDIGAFEGSTNFWYSKTATSNTVAQTTSNWTKYRSGNTYTCQSGSACTNNLPGTVSVTSNVLTGVNTTFFSDFSVGDNICKSDGTLIDAIDDITSNTRMDISNGGSGVASTSYFNASRYTANNNPSNFTSTTQIFNIQSGHQYQVGAAWSGASSNKVIIENGGALDINNKTVDSWGYFEIQGSGVSNSGAIYNSTGSSLTTFANPITLKGDATFKSSGTGGLDLSGIISGAYNITKTGTEFLTLSGANSFSGSTTISDGKLNISSDGNLGTVPGSTTASSISINGGTLGITSDLTLSTNRGITIGSSNGSIDVSSTKTLTYGGVISGSGNLTKTGAGSLTLSGVNTFTGSTILSNGTITLGVANALPISASAGVIQTTTTSGVTLNLGLYDLGTSTTSANSAGQLDLDVNTTIQLGTSGSNKYYFKASNGQTWNGTTITIDNWNGTAGSSNSSGRQIFIGSDATGLTQSQLDKITFTNYTAGAMILSTGEIVPICVAPATPGAISGTTTQCPSLASQTYSISSVSGATSYTWTVPTGWTITAGAGTTSITVTTGAASQNGDITVTATNSCGTSAAQTLAVTVNALTTPTFTQVAAICSGGSLSALPTTSNNSITGTWSPALDNTATTTYTFTPTSTASPTCATTTTMSITVNPRPTSVISGDQTICNSATSSNISIALTGSQPWSLTYTDGTTPVSVSNITSSPYTFTVSPSSTKTYTVTALTDANCTANAGDRTGTATVTVNALTTPTFTQVAAICSGGSLSALPTTSNNSITGTWSPALDNTATTTYTFTPTSTASPTCATTTTMSITVNPRPTSVISGDQTICNGATSSNISIALTGSQPWSLTYTDGTTPVSVSNITSSPYTFTVSPSSTKTYTVSALSDVNCTANAGDRTGSAAVTVNARPTSVISGTQTICNGATSSNISIDLTGSQPWSLTYTDGTTPVSVTGITSSPYTFTVSPSSSKTYTVSALSDANCTANAGDKTGSATVTVNPRPTSVISGTQTICNGATSSNISIALTGSQPWSLTYTDGITPVSVTGITSSPYTFTVSPSSSKTYTVSALSDANCTANAGDKTGSATVTVNPRPTSVISGTQTICNGATSSNISIALTGSQPWSLTYTDGTTPVSVTGITSSPYTFTVSPSSSKTYTVSALSDANCTANAGDKTGSATVTVNAISNAGTTSSDQTITSGNSPTDISISGYTGTIQWEYSDDNSSYASVSGASTSATLTSATMGTLTATRYYRAVVTNGVCASATSNVITITVTSANATITLASNTVSAANNCAASTKVPIQSFSLAVTNGTGNLTNVGFTTTGSYAQADISKYQLYYGTTNSLGSATQLGSDLSSSGGQGTRTFSAFTSPSLTNNTTYYFWITADIASGATNDNTIAVNAITTSDLTTTSNTAGTTSAGGTQTLKATPTTANAGSDQISTATCGVTQTTLGGNNPTIGTGAWTIQSGSGGSLTSASTYNTTFSGTLGNTYTLRWTISNTSCTSLYDDVIITFNTPMSTTPANGDYVWKGTDNTWSTASNWLSHDGTSYSVAGSAPTSSNRVIITAANSCPAAQPTLASNVSVGSLIIESGASLNQSTYTTTINGDFTNNGTFTAGTGTTKFTGTGTVTGSTSFYDLIMDGSGITTTLASDHSITHGLTLTNGILSVATGKTLTLGASGTDITITGGSSNSFIATPTTTSLVKYFVNNTATTYNFPLGETTRYTPMTLNFTAGATTGAYITTYVKNTVAPGFVAANFQNYISRYWSVSPTGLSGTPNYTITYTYVTGDVTGDETKLVPVKVSSGAWYKPVTFTNTSAAPNITNGTAEGSGGVDVATNTLTWSGLSTFSFDMAAGDEASALPIHLLYFKAKQEAQKVRLDWATASETNNDYFTVERSQDGEHFNELFKKPGAGISTTNLYYFGYDNKPFDGVSYYRLKQTDYDGKYEYSGVESVNFKEIISFEGLKIYPNPSEDNVIHVDFSSETKQAVTCVLHDAVGKEIAVEVFEAAKGPNEFTLSYPSVASGMYILEIRSSDGAVQQTQLKLGK